MIFDIIYIILMMQWFMMGWGYSFFGMQGLTKWQTELMAIIYFLMLTIMAIINKFV